MGLNKTSLVLIVVSLLVLIAEFIIVFNGFLNPARAILDMAIVIVNGLIMTFALALLFIGFLFSTS